MGLVARIVTSDTEAASQSGIIESQVSPTELALARAIDGMWIAYQPIVSLEQHAVFGYEALLRSREPLLATPRAVLQAAEEYDRLSELGARVRDRVCDSLDLIPPGTSMFVNLHPADLLDPALFDPSSRLAKHAEEVILEVTERATLDSIPDVRERFARLRSMGYRLALDDLGSGYAGLNSLALLEPEVVKLDMVLVRNVHIEPLKRRIVRTMIALASEMGALVVAEGIECKEERDALADWGCDLFQGFYIARPNFPIPEPDNV